MADDRTSGTRSSAEIELSPGTERVVVIVTWLIAAGFLCAAISVWTNLRLWESRSLPAQGVVIGFEDYMTNGPDTVAPIVRFTADDGFEVTFTSGLAEYPPAYCVGAKVDVRYQPDVHSDAETVRALGFPLSVIVLAGFACGIGFFAGLFTRHHLQRPKPRTVRL